MTKEIRTWADAAMFRAEEVDTSGPKVYLLEMTSDPLGSIAALSAMYTGKVTRSKDDVTDELVKHLDLFNVERAKGQTIRKVLGPIVRVVLLSAETIGESVALVRFSSRGDREPYWTHDADTPNWKARICGHSCSPRGARRRRTSPRRSRPGRCARCLLWSR